MSRLKFKLEINPGGHGVRLDKLGKLSNSVEKFLRSLAEDAGAKVAPGEFVASQFYDSSFGSTVETFAEYTPEAVASFDSGVSFFSGYNGGNSTPAIPPTFSRKTIQSFVALGDDMDNDEAIRIGLLNGGESEPRWEKLTKSAAVLIKEYVETPYHYRGAIQGKLGTWFKESGYFNLKALAANSIVKCHYGTDFYSKVYSAFADKDAVVHVSGNVTADRLSGDPTDVTVSDIQFYPRLSDKEFSALAGSDPTIAGDDDVVTVIERMRDDAD
jgi:hypothetical protein